MTAGGGGSPAAPWVEAPARAGRSAGDGVRPGTGIEEYIDRIAEEMHERVEHQRLVYKRAFGNASVGTARPAHCPLADCRRLAAMRAAIRETIAVLEETRSAFKSKRLEVMRRKLIDVLSD